MLKLGAEHLAEKRNGVRILRKDSTHSKTGSIRLDVEGDSEIRRNENGGGGHHLLEFEESRLSIIIPMKVILAKQGSQWGIQERVTAYETAVEAR